MIAPDAFTYVNEIEARVKAEWRPRATPGFARSCWQRSARDRWNASHQDPDSSYELWEAACSWILESSAPLTQATLIELNARVTGQAVTGFRTEAVGTQTMTYAPPGEVARAVGAAFADFSAAGADLIALAKLAQRLLTIHPFMNGNGRAVRLFVDLALWRGGYPPPYFESPIDFIMANSWGITPGFPLEHAVISLGLALERRLDLLANAR